VPKVSKTSVVSAFRRTSGALAGVVLISIAAVLGAQELPAGPGAELVGAKCTACHATDLIASQRLSPQGWARELDKMTRWGAALTDVERTAIQHYLEDRFPAPHARAGARPAAAGSPAPAQASPGAAVFERACRACHERDLVEAQRLTPAGWQREVDKMRRWGAALSDAEATALVEYLAARYPWP
jgi:cytochrome c5